MESGLAAALTGRFQDLASGSLAPVEVVVLDSGVDATHPDLAGRIAATFSVEMVEGKPQVVEHPANINNDVFGHGTAVASIIAKLAPNARIVDVRILGKDNSGSGGVLVEGLRLAVEQRKSRVVNMSLAAKASFAPQLMELCEQAYRQNQVVVAAKRNMPLVDNGFPAEFTSCISVDRDHFPSSFQVRYRSDDWIEYAGNGTDVAVAAPGGGYTTKTGTSFATPAISALCALLCGRWGELRPFEVKTILKAHSEP
jgi:subtilisin family serine protease